jgi:hypothetical protein
MGGAGFAEVAMFHRPSRTLLLTDLVVNIEARKLPWLLRPVAGLLGILAPSGRAPAYLRAIVQLRRTSAEAAAARLLGWRPEQVILHPWALCSIGMAPDGFASRWPGLSPTAAALGQCITAPAGLETELCGASVGPGQP